MRGGRDSEGSQEDYEASAEKIPRGARQELRGEQRGRLRGSREKIPRGARQRLLGEQGKVSEGSWEMTPRGARERFQGEIHFQNC